MQWPVTVSSDVTDVLTHAVSQDLTVCRERCIGRIVSKPHRHGLSGAVVLSVGGTPCRTCAANVAVSGPAVAPAAVDDPVAGGKVAPRTVSRSLKESSHRLGPVSGMTPEG
jgi:hypothetical protein